VTSLAAKWDAGQRNTLEAVLDRIGAKAGSAQKLLARLGKR
jgi:hypothetical protein